MQNINKYSLLIIFMLSVQVCLSQNNLQKKITINAKNQPLKQILDDISTQSGFYFSYNNQQIDDNKKITLIARNQQVENVIKKLSSETGLRYTIIDKQIILKPITTTHKNNNSNANNHQNNTRTNNVTLYTLSGYTKDTSNNEVLIGATIVIKSKQIATSSNSYGYYSLSLPKGNYSVQFSYLGYETKTVNINLSQNVNLSEYLQANVQEINIITVTQDNINSSTSNPLKRFKLSTNDILNKPMIGGEYDAVKSLQSVAGISMFGEGSVMFNVRGGSRGQNAIFIDEAPLYNPSHLLGFFSAVAPEAINSMSVYKSAFPIQYGGRLSSMIDIRTKDGNMNKLGFGAIFSPILSTFSLDGPLKKGKSSFIVTFRKSNINYLFKKNAPNLDINFRDFHLKYNKKFSRKNRIFLALYSGYDNISVSDIAIRWKNNTFTFRWNHLFNDKLFSNTTFLTSSYNYFFFYSVQKNIYWSSKISTISLKNDYTFYQNDKNTFYFGFETKIQTFNPGNLHYGTHYWHQIWASNVLKNTLYFGGLYKFNHNLSLNYGIKFNNWNNFGETNVYTFNSEHQVTDTLHFNGEIFNTYNKFEPRLSLLWVASSSSSFTVSYDHNVQFLHFISNSISPFTTLDAWLPASTNLKPQSVNQFTLGYLLKLPEYQLSIETYYKDFNNQTDYNNQPDLFLNPYFESQLRFGKTTAYGIEFSLQKKVGTFRFITTYTFSRAKRITPDVNLGLSYPALWDKPHNFYTNISWQITATTNINASFTYVSGNKFSSPTGFYSFQNYTVPIYERKNNDKLPDYHRLDVSIRKRLNKNENNRFEHFLTFSIYNLYGRNNVIAVNFDKIETSNGKYLIPTDYVTENQLTPTSMSLLGFVPSISYQFKFR